MAFFATAPRRLAAVGIAALLAVGACSTAAPVEDDDGDSGGAGSAAQACFQGVPPNFEEEVAPILEGSCVQGSHCHSAVGYAPTVDNGCQGSVTLVNISLGGDGCPELSLVERLLDMPATQCFKPVPLVVPCDLERSYLMVKIHGSSTMCSGEPMPRDAPPLSPEQIATLENWILAGAPSATRPADACATACN
jgi:hypothetical protein